ncbi:hypothetical protein DMENIID0001_051390 [Sergentomyia squamirostris]
MKTIVILFALFVTAALGATGGDEMKDKRALYGFGYGLAPYSGYPGTGAGYVHGYHGYGYRGFGYPFDAYHGHPYAHGYAAHAAPGGLAYHGAHFGYAGAPFLH